MQQCSKFVKKMNWPRFSFEPALFHFELALPSLNWHFRNDTFSSHFLLWLMISFYLWLECLECSWLPWQHVEIVNSPGLHSPIGDPIPQSHWSDALSHVMYPLLHQRGVSLAVTDRPTGWRTIVPCYLSMAEWSVTGPMVCQCRRWVLVIWTPPGPDLLPQTPWPTPAADPHPPTYPPTHPSQHTYHRPPPLQLRQPGGIR